MSGTSSVGQASVYEAGDQRNSKQSEIDTAERYNEGTANAHKSNDSTSRLKFAANEDMNLEDERSIANRLANEESKGEKDTDSKETKEYKQDPTLPARNHGNEPSKGAKIDKELMEEEQEELRRKGKA